MIEVPPPISLAVTVAAVFGLLACEQQAVRQPVSLEEAKKITADIEHPAAFQLPPRSVTDLTRLLNSPAYVKTDVLAQLKRDASAEPPSDLDGDESIQFYLRQDIRAPTH